jgi:hypothetical protein
MAHLFKISKTTQVFKIKNKKAVSRTASSNPPPTKPISSGLDKRIVVSAGKIRLRIKAIPIKARKMSAGSNCLRKVVVNIRFLLIGAIFSKFANVIDMNSEFA